MIFQKVVMHHKSIADMGGTGKMNQGLTPAAERAAPDTAAACTADSAAPAAVE